VSEPQHPSGTRATPVVMVLDEADNVAVAVGVVEAGSHLAAGGASIVALEDVPIGHKIALAPIPVGEVVRKYGEPIGVATQPIEAGMHVHVHNVVSSRLP